MAQPGGRRSDRNDLHRLVDEIPEGEFEPARRYLEYLRNMQDPFIRRLMEAPLDDETLTEEDFAAIEESGAEIARGEYVTTDELKREFGA